MIFFVEKKPRLFGLHMIHNVDCELLPADSLHAEKLIADDMEGAIAQAGLIFNQVRVCGACDLTNMRGRTEIGRLKV
jgi:hypothetical protein